MRFPGPVDIASTDGGSVSDRASGPTSLRRRSIAKAITYRMVVMAADSLAVYVLTGAWRIALGFMIVSNLYTSVLYFLHERAWARVRWGLGPGRTARAGDAGASARLSES